MAALAAAGALIRRRSRAGCANLRGSMAQRQNEPPVLDFERPVVELERKIEELRQFAQGSSELAREIKMLEARVEELQREIFADLTPWQKVLLSRHPGRPYTQDYLARLITDFLELHGDRQFGDDPAIVGGLGWFEGTPVLCLGHQKGRTTKENVMPQLRHAQARGLPQGAAPDGAGRAVQAPHPLLHRHHRRLSRASTPRSAGRPRPSPRTWR